ncbi:MAG: transcriptional regulator [Lentisphaerae bacterium RIFOXYB12_FULL_65_16]|nr:MAG: transcriptional regulator [Lentisphaerae bacterium RIFOXYA12_64_32]OGV91030.1 MAG: transcriptional regulator [Lentisphaerae bacterium RIFOXYB12_FULL_65_16]
MPAREPTRPTILVIDDEKNTRDGLDKALCHKYSVLLAESANAGLDILNREHVDVVLTDLRMPGIDGMAFTREVAARQDAPLVIMLTAYGSVQTAIEAMKVGAYDYLTKPVNIDNLEMMIERGLESRRLRAENEQLRRELDQRYGLEGMIGNSRAMTEVFDTVRQIADARSTVLLTGESGTGKELIAHAVHRLSGRSSQPFIVVHCAALNPNLLESELFGHEKGSYTGAHQQVLGRFERANGGTLFLDEIGDIDLSTQIKLLRVLETRTFERVGGNTPIETDVRLIAATNCDLKRRVDEGRFREDLYYRLHVVSIRLPPLRERAEDIPLLLDHFLRKAAEENGRTLSGFSPETVKVLTAYAWPGNVRELRNCVERMVVMSRGSNLTLKDVPADVRTAISDALESKDGGAEAGAKAPSLDIDAHEKNLIAQALRETRGNRTEAARQLGISRRTLHRKLHTYGLENL